MKPTTLTVCEHEQVPITESGSESALSEREADEIDRIALSRPGFAIRGYRAVKFTQYAGVIYTGERTLEILPKLGEDRDVACGRSIVLSLLHQAGVVPISRQSSAGHFVTQMPLLEVFISAFFDCVGDLVRGGLIHKYLEQQEDLTVMRGRLLTNRQVGPLFNRPDVLACQFDELTIDNTWNRLIKAGLAAVRPWITHPTLSRRWVELAFAFTEVDLESEPLAKLRALPPDRQARRYSKALNWVRWILATLSPNVRAGDAEAPGLLFDMNRLFETALSLAIERDFRSDTSARVSRQEQAKHLVHLHGDLRSPECALRPDLIVRRDNCINLIADIKWKRLERSPRHGHPAPTESDFHQLLAYAAAFQVPAVALVYPTTETDSTSTVYHLPSLGLHSPRLHILHALLPSLQPACGSRSWREALAFDSLTAPT